jgi:hypothetical protein
VANLKAELSPHQHIPLTKGAQWNLVPRVSIKQKEEPLEGSSLVYVRAHMYERMYACVRDHLMAFVQLSLLI